ncbi:hypothetical protein EDB83DRAFT_2318040 [Lactarius deliciosus]|nr:hypothetical protein EDB83DRAFT_2318040 [Lactarius deliciosus]
MALASLSSCGAFVNPATEPEQDKNTVSRSRSGPRARHQRSSHASRSGGRLSYTDDLRLLKVFYDSPHSATRTRTQRRNAGCSLLLRGVDDLDLGTWTVGELRIREMGAGRWMERASEGSRHNRYIRNGQEKETLNEAVTDENYYTVSVTIYNLSSAGIAVNYEGIDGHWHLHWPVLETGLRKLKAGAVGVRCHFGDCAL